MRLDEERIDQDAYGPGVLDPELTSHLEVALGRLTLSSLMNQSGQDFLRGALQMIDATIRPTVLFIAEKVDPFDDAVVTIVALASGTQVPNFRVPLSVSPCGRVLEPRHLCVYQRNVSALFPHCVQLAQMRAEGFIGMPLISTRGSVLGLLAAVTREPLVAVDAGRRLFLLFGGRIALDLERRRAGSGDEAARVHAATLLEEQRLRDAMRSNAQL